MQLCIAVCIARQNDLFDPIVEGFCDTAVEPAVISGLPVIRQASHLSKNGELGTR